MLLESDGEVVDPETGEVTNPFADVLATLKDGIENKVEGCCKVLKQLDADMAMLKEEQDRLAKRRKSIERNKEGLREYVRENLQQADMKKVKTPMFTVSLSAAKKRVVILDEDLIPAEFRAEAKTPPPDKAAIKAALEAGTKVPGASLGMGDPTLTVR